MGRGLWVYVLVARANEGQVVCRGHSSVLLLRVSGQCLLASRGSGERVCMCVRCVICARRKRKLINVVLMGEDGCCAQIVFTLLVRKVVIMRCIYGSRSHSCITLH